MHDDRVGVASAGPAQFGLDTWYLIQDPSYQYLLLFCVLFGNLEIRGCPAEVYNETIPPPDQP
jgi:hypothetical protein